MASLREEAKKYTPKETRNIAELAKVSVDLDLHQKDGTTTNEKGEEKSFSYECVEIEGVEYRVPITVKKQLKAHLENNPDLKFFKVIKEGTGKQTEYTVIPLADNAPNKVAEEETQYGEDVVDIENI